MPKRGNPMSHAKCEGESGKMEKMEERMKAPPKKKSKKAGKPGY